jgi:hypothetical protein
VVVRHSIQWLAGRAAWRASGTLRQLVTSPFFHGCCESSRLNHTRLDVETCSLRTLRLDFTRCLNPTACWQYSSSTTSSTELGGLRQRIKSQEPIPRKMPHDKRRTGNPTSGGTLDQGLQHSSDCARHLCCGETATAAFRDLLTRLFWLDVPLSCVEPYIHANWPGEMIKRTWSAPGKENLVAH